MNAKALLLGIILCLSAAELSSYLGLYVFEALRPGFLVNVWVKDHFSKIEESYRKQYAQEWLDQELGWSPRPNTESTSKNSAGEKWTRSYDQHAARTDLTGLQDIAAHSYGDSFVHCDEVNNDQTWQHFLGKKFGARVVNYGIGGQGPTQALRRFQRHIEDKHTAPITILGLNRSSALRVANVFRPFSNPRSGIKLGFKPAYVLESGIVKFVPNLYTDPNASLQQLEELATQAARDDYWTSQKVFLEFPYFPKLLTLVSRSAQLEDPWSSSKVLRPLHHVVEEFVTTSKTAGSKPVIVFLPDGKSLEKGSAPYNSFRDKLRVLHHELEVIDIAEHEFDRDTFHVLPLSGHTSVTGNKVTADVLYSALSS